MSINGPDELEGMRAAGAVVRLMLEAMKGEVRPGIITRSSTKWARGDEGAARRNSPHRRAGGAISGVSCISLNDEAVHGIPGPRALQPGDLVKRSM